MYVRQSDPSNSKNLRELAVMLTLPCTYAICTSHAVC